MVLSKKFREYTVTNAVFKLRELTRDHLELLNNLYEQRSKITTVVNERGRVMQAVLHLRSPGSHPPKYREIGIEPRLVQILIDGKFVTHLIKEGRGSLQLHPNWEKAFYEQRKLKLLGAG